MGLEAIYPKPRLSAGPGHAVYPYLLRDVAIVRANQVWSTDITYIRLRAGFVYLMAILDWFSRFVIGWALSTTLDGQFCLEALEAALTTTRPEIFNTDQGPQFTSPTFTEVLKTAGVQISMGQRVRGTPVAHGEVRGGVLEGLRIGPGGCAGAGAVLPLLQ